MHGRGLGRDGHRMAYFSPQVFGGGQFYVTSTSDAPGKPLDGVEPER